MNLVTVFYILSISFLVSTFNISDDFEVTLAGGYSEDTVSVVLNGDTIISNSVITSNAATGLSNTGINYKNGKLEYFVKEKTGSLSFPSSQYLRIQIIINKLPYGFTVNLRKGKHIVISKHSYYYNVYCNQYKKRPYFE